MLMKKQTHKDNDTQSVALAQTPTEKNQKGFSLTELLVVMAIMALLASLVAPRLFNQLDKSKVSAARAQIRSLKTSLDALRLDIGRYPTREEGLSLLVKPPVSAGGNNNGQSLWIGPYIDQDIPFDPWGNAYIYVDPASSETGVPRIISYGQDGKAGGTGLDSDVSL